MSNFISDGYRKFHRDASRSVAFLATDDFAATGADYIPVRNANYQIFIQRIIVNISTVAAQTLTFQDDAGTPVVIAVLPASAARGAQTVLDGGARGIPLTIGKNLDIVASAAGVAGSIIVECYQKLGNNVIAGSAN